MKTEEVKKLVRKGYGEIAKMESSCCGSVKSCCGSVESVQEISRSIGYTEEELKAAPPGANLGLGCGNPLAFASLKEGETVLDLGSGAGFDCFLAASRVGEKGRVIGVDMTPEMVEKARENARQVGSKNVEFRLGEIEHLPVADCSVDVVISNCVINLSPEKERVFEEAFRVLKPGGRLMISDIVLLKELPEVLKESVEAYLGCVSGALLKDEYLRIIKAAGFEDIQIMDQMIFQIELISGDPTVKGMMENVKLSPEKIREMADSILSIKVHGIKPVRS